MQTLDKLQKQLLLGTEINAILKQSNRLLDIIKENQDYSYKLQKESDRLEKEIQEEQNKPDHGFSFPFKGRL
jgi:hypothetical protein